MLFAAPPPVRLRLAPAPAAAAAALLAAVAVGFGPARPARAEEMRAAWVASVYNLNFPSRPGSPPAAQQEEIRRIVQTAAQRGLNALLVQVRPEGDALYRPGLEPWSRFLTGTQGADPGYDPLETFLEEGRRHGVAIHAWINPYRAAIHAADARAASHPARTLGPAAVHRVGPMLWLDPGAPAVRAHVVRVVADLVGRYPVAGVVLDDYFYPYPEQGRAKGAFPDQATYARYRAGGGGLALADWRRENVNELVRDLHHAVKSARPGAAFGVSPFGVYRSGQPAAVRADLDQYADLYADPLSWLRQGWVDYLSPQLYWRDGGPQSYSALLRWWRSPEANPRGTPIYPSIALDRMADHHRWPASEIALQLRAERDIAPRGNGGFVLWNVGALLNNTKGIGQVVAQAATP